MKVKNYRRNSSTFYDHIYLIQEYCLAKSPLSRKIKDSQWYINIEATHHLAHNKILFINFE